MSYNLRQHQRAKAQRLEDAFAGVPETVFARLGVTTATLAAIDRQLLGEMILPGMTRYPQFSKGSGLSVFDQGEPLLVVCCADPHDVWLALKATHDHGWPFVARSGGHSTAGFSSNGTVIIDLTGLDDIALCAENRVSVGPGATFGKLNRFMKSHRLHIPTGNCDDVRCGGYVQGGGYGYTSRQFGMQCDTVAELTVLLGDGRTVKASATVNRDLFWALRGGTGNNFGIVVNIVYDAVPLGEIWGFVYSWDAPDAPAAMARAEDAFGPAKGLEIGYTGNITTVAAGTDHKPVYMMSGVCIHGPEVGKAALAPMLSLGTPTCMLDEVGSYFDMNDAVEGKLPGIPEPIGETYEIKSSGYLSTPMGLDGWQRFFGYFVDNIARTNPYNLVVLEAYGGAINTVPWDATAFVHRDSIMEIYVDAFWRTDGGLGSYDQAQSWMSEINALLKPYLNGHWYQNYPQRDMPNFRWQYWGDAFNSLLFVKRKYDAGGRFAYEQSISPYPNEPGITRSHKPSIWHDPTIVDSGLTPRFA